VAALRRKAPGPCSDFGSQQDFKDVTQVIGGADQGGSGCPTATYYLKDDAR